ncbi:MAG: hypothetical protein ACHQQR_16610, partial [Gemmatimonadales bacterium]
MTRQFVLTASLIVGLARVASPQAGTAPPNAAAQCQTDRDAYQSKKFSELRSAGTRLTSELVAPIVAEGQRMARECAGRISLESASAAELVSLASVYLGTSDTAKAKTAAALVLAKPGLSEPERANAMLAGEQLAIATFDPFAGINPEAERFVRDVDAMSDAVLPQKVRAHEQLLGQYGYADIDDG